MRKASKMGPVKPHTCYSMRLDPAEKVEMACFILFPLEGVQS